VPFDLAAAIKPATTALLVNECQRDVVGDLSRLPALAEAAAPAVEKIGVLVRAARAAGVQVLHATAYVRSDGRGANTNTPINAGLRRRAAAAAAGPRLPPEEGATIVESIGVLPEDIVIQRIHGMSPLTDTGADPIMRNLGVKTLVVTGVSLNIAVPNVVMDAVNRGYVVVVPRDAVAGVPPEYGEAVLKNTIGYLACVADSEELLSVWAASSKAPEATSA
jgi:nicotinamidase-related amidase